jgi:hypothetical protein
MLAPGSSPRGTCSSGASPGRAADPDPNYTDLLDPDLGVEMSLYISVLRIRSWIRRIRIFLGLLDPDLLVRSMDLDPDPSIIEQKCKINLNSYCFVTSL